MVSLLPHKKGAKARPVRQKQKNRSRKSLKLSGSLRVDPKYWDAKGQRVKGKSQDAKVTNSRLGKIYFNVPDTFNRMEAAGKEFDVYDLKNQLCGISDGPYFN
ncbi:MAG: hypothetical protein PHI28_19630 [Mangrovibacterium sp.]|nr:hypothetical protein [Mangrovibacterium sp.]